MKSFYFALFFLLLFACKKPYTGANSAKEQSKLEQIAAAKDMTADLKLHAMGESIAKLMDECNKIADDTEMIAHLREFHDNNRQALYQIQGQTDEWQRNMSEEERVFFAIEVSNREYVKKLRNLIPLIQKRIQDYPEVKEELTKLLRNVEMRR